PVIFAQRRTGRQGRPFTVYKLRTMRPTKAASAEASRKLVPALPQAFRSRHEEARVTRLGAWLRRCGLDELPQILNLLKGDMRWIGPRPLPVEDGAGVVSGQQSWRRLREAATPGLTGLYQVAPLRRELGYADMCVLDAYYIHNRGPALQARILARTLPAMWHGWGGRRPRPVLRGLWGETSLSRALSRALS
ncbi:MAG: sugar transferase, partial [Kiritimatiellae bacterium]|nr:sugar transferase [Kiritimatiellia bacterium]